MNASAMLKQRLSMCPSSAWDVLKRCQHVLLYMFPFQEALNLLEALLGAGGLLPPGWEALL